MQTSKDYTVDFMRYGLITVPAGTPLTNKTAKGEDKNYHFVNSYSWVIKNYPLIANILIHDLKYHGKECCLQYH